MFAANESIISILAKYSIVESEMTYDKATLNILLQAISFHIRHLKRYLFVFTP
jgi:hypothetical protein